METELVVKRFGTSAAKLTSAVGTYGQLTSPSMSLDLRNKLLILDFYIEDADKTDSITILFQVDGSWTPYIYYVKFNFDTGWNRAVLNVMDGAFSGLDRIEKNVRNITAIRVRVTPKSGQQVYAIFDRLVAIDNPLKKGIVTITFDDGHPSIYNIAMPKMNDYGYKGVAYVPISFIGEPYATLAQLKELQSLGWDIGAHGWVHDYDYSTPEKIHREFVQPYEYLVRNGLSKGADHLAYPGGVITPEVEEVVQKIYTTARWKGFSGPPNETIPPHAANTHRLKLVNGAENRVANAKTSLDIAEVSKAWTILMFHDIRETVGDGETHITPASFNEIIEYIASKDLTVLTMSEIAMYLPFVKNQTLERKAGLLETNDIEVINNTKGFVLTDRTTSSRYRLKVDNGTLGVEEIT